MLGFADEGSLEAISLSLQCRCLFYMIPFSSIFFGLGLARDRVSRFGIR